MGNCKNQCKTLTIYICCLSFEGMWCLSRIFERQKMLLLLKSGQKFCSFPVVSSSTSSWAATFTKNNHNFFNPFCILHWVIEEVVVKDTSKWSRSLQFVTQNGRLSFNNLQVVGAFHLALHASLASYKEVTCVVLVFLEKRNYSCFSKEDWTTELTNRGLSSI